jgi:hypothetical protein
LLSEVRLDGNLSSKLKAQGSKQMEAQGSKLKAQSKLKIKSTDLIEKLDLLNPLGSLRSLRSLTAEVSGFSYLTSVLCILLSEINDCRWF